MNEWNMFMIFMGLFYVLLWVFTIRTFGIITDQIKLSGNTKLYYLIIFLMSNFACDAPSVFGNPEINNSSFFFMIGMYCVFLAWGLGFFIFINHVMDVPKDTFKSLE